MRMRLQALRSFTGRTTRGNQQVTAGQILKLPYERADGLLKSGKFMLLPWQFIQKSSESVSAWLEKLSDSEKETYRDRIKHMGFDGGLSTDEFRIEIVRQIIKERVIKGKCDPCVRVQGCLLSSAMRKLCGGAFA